MNLRYRPRWPLLASLVLGIGLLIVLFGYTESRPRGEAVPRRGGVYVEGVAGSPRQVNPLFASFNEADRDVTALVFSGLVRLVANGDVQPDLAERWTVTPDGRSYVFELRPGLVWHDGAPLDAEDVLFTIQTIQDPDFDGDPSLVSTFRNVELQARDPRTVVMTLPQPFAPFLAHATVGILPEHLLGGGDAGALGDAAFNQMPVGSGPFRVVEFTPQAAQLESFESYHLGEPLIERLDLRFHRDDAALFTALSNGEVDGALFRSGLSREQLASIDGDNDLVRRGLHGTGYSVVYLNQRDAIFRETDLRRALQHGLDREVLIEDVLGGQALPLDGPIVAGLWAHSPQGAAYAYDRAAAETLLDSAGWALDGDARATDGEALSFSLATSDDPNQVGVAQEVAQQWAELGMRVNVQVYGASQFVEQVLLSRRFQAALVSLDPGPDPDLYPIWHSSQVLGEGRNLSSFSNLDMDRLLEEARLTTSAARRATLYRTFQQLFAQAVPAVLLYTPTYQYVVESRVRGLSPGLLFDPGSRFSDVHRWYVETAAREGDG